jgi:hypothetical protein
MKQFWRDVWAFFRMLECVGEDPYVLFGKSRRSLWIGCSRSGVEFGPIPIKE